MKTKLAFSVATVILATSTSWAQMPVQIDCSQEALVAASDFSKIAKLSSQQQTIVATSYHDKSQKVLIVSGSQNPIEVQIEAFNSATHGPVCNVTGVKLY